MKKLLIISLFIITKTILYSQNSWVTMLPDNGRAIKMIRTNDNKYLAIALLNETSSGTGYYNKLGFYKIDKNGIIEWNRYYLYPDSGEFNPNIDILQLNNGNLFLSGRLSLKPFLATFDYNGNNIWFNKYLDYPLNNDFENPIEINDSTIWVTGGGNPNNMQFVTKVNLNGDILEIDSTKIMIPSGDANYGNKMIKLNSDTLLFTTYDGKYIYTDFNLNIIKQVKYNIKPLIVKRDNNYNFFIHDNSYYDAPGGYNNGKGFVVFDSDLDSIRNVPVSQYYGLGAIMTSPKDMIINNDNKIIMSGSLTWVSQQYPYIIKTDEYGNSTIIKAYTNVITQEAISIFEEDDLSFVTLQDRYDPPHYMYVVRTNIDGTVDSELFNNKPEEKILVYPNPANNNINIESPSKFKSIELIDITGKVVKSIKSETILVNINLSDVSNGIYTLRVSENDNISYRKIEVMK